jgi:hypothetical protein
MRWLALCAGLVGCNQVFDLAPTELATEAPVVCPPIGTTPSFETTVRQAIRQDCAGYTESADTGMALAWCRSSNGGFVPSYGPAGGPLSPITLTTPNPAEMFPWAPVLTPEGDELYWSASQVGTIRLARFRLVGDTWQFSDYTPIPALPIADPGAPSRGPHRHVLYYINAMLHEAAQDDSGTWTEILPPYDMLRVNANRPYLSPDGLRLFASIVETTGEHGVIYADRPSIDARFGAPVHLDTVPPTQDTFITENCGRAYFSGLANILFEEQSR